MSRFKIIKNDRFRDYEIQMSPEGSREDILEAIINNFEFMNESCNGRLYVCHFVVHLSDYDPNLTNKYISDTLASFRKTMLNRKIKTEYVWVREIGHQETHEGLHYHIAVVLDGKKIQSSNNITLHLNQLLSNRLMKKCNYFHICRPQKDDYGWGKKVHKNLDNFNDTILWISYLAKCKTKGAPTYKKTFGYSKGYKNAV
ncbi:inovirus-type Gp2 protein [Lentisphaerota bacterium WC36G]|nr:inovirus Gp2 family protein [Lentisphaerae bacterium WC36]